ncbi:MAG: hypothetical protein HOO06_05725 [Bdellovibrionaceae bacterium]|jgi:hypothetical protein|nr:hypothetical protein [Pseudobdellovibrionaceae bacterium]
MKVILIVLLLSSVKSFAGESSGGGKGVLCLGENGQIQSVETLDSFEAKNLWGLEYAEDHITSPIQQAQNALNHLTKNRTTRFGRDRDNFYTLNDIYSNMRLLGGGARPKPIEDHDSPLGPPEGCSFVQIGLDTPQTNFIVSKKLWEKLSNTEKAVLLVHETIYRRSRWNYISSSRRIRKAVAHGFARTELKPTGEGIPSDYWYCISNNDKVSGYHSFYAYSNNDGFLVLQFEALAGMWVFDKTQLTVPYKVKPHELDKSASPAGFGIYRYTTNSVIDGTEPISMFISKEGVREIGIASTHSELEGHGFSCISKDLLDEGLE